MPASRHWSIAVSGGLLLVAVLYFAKLNQSPPYLSIEELETGRQAISIATTGRSLSGQVFPLYVANRVSKQVAIRSGSTLTQRC